MILTFHPALGAFLREGLLKRGIEASLDEQARALQLCKVHLVEGP